MNFKWRPGLISTSLVLLVGCGFRTQGLSEWEIYSTHSLGARTRSTPTDKETTSGIVLDQDVKDAVLLKALEEEETTVED